MIILHLNTISVGTCRFIISNFIIIFICSATTGPATYAGFISIIILVFCIGQMVEGTVIVQYLVYEYN